MAFNPYKWYTVISDLIKSSDPDIDTSIGTLIGDTTLLPMSVLYEKTRIIKDLLLKIVSLDGITDALSDTEFLNDAAIALDTTSDQVVILLKSILDNIAADYGLVRKAAAPSSGIGYFALSAKDDYTGTYRISQTDQVQSIFGLAYRPSKDYVFIIDGLTPETSIETYYVPELGRYAFPVHMTSAGVGAAGNIDSGQIYSTVFLAPSDFEFVTNLTPFSGGRSEETDAELISRIKSKWTGSNLGTRGGYLNVLSENGITDAYIAGAGSPYLYRSSAGGSVDIYIRAFQNISVTVPGLELTGSRIPNVTTYKIKDLIDNNIVSLTLPVRSVTGVVSTGETPPGDLISILRIVPDESAAYRGSSMAGDQLSVSMYDSSSVYKYKFDVTFLYNYYVDYLQKLFTSDDYHVLGQNVMVREAQPLNIKASLSIRTLPGYNSDTVRTNVTNSILEYVNSQKMGAKISQSDIVSVAENVDGVDNVLVPFTVFNAVGNTDVTESIQASPIKFVQFGSFSFPRFPVSLLESGGNLVESASYFYKVIAIDEDSNRTSSVEVTKTTDNVFKTIQISWAKCDNAREYHLYRGNSSGVYDGYFIISPSENPVYRDSGSVIPISPPIAQDLETPEEESVSLLKVNIV